MTAYAYARRRCVSPSGIPGGWHGGLRPTWDAMAEAVRTAQRNPHLRLDDEETARLWQGLKTAGWSLETEKERDE